MHRYLLQVARYGAVLVHVLVVSKQRPVAGGPSRVAGREFEGFQLRSKDPKFRKTVKFRS